MTAGASSHHEQRTWQLQAGQLTWSSGIGGSDSMLRSASGTASVRLCWSPACECRRRLLKLPGGDGPSLPSEIRRLCSEHNWVTKGSRCPRRAACYTVVSDAVPLEPGWQTRNSQEGAALALHVDDELAAAAAHAPCSRLRLRRLGPRHNVSAAGSIAAAGPPLQRGQRRHQLHAQQRCQAVQDAHIPIKVAIMSSGAVVSPADAASKALYQTHRHAHTI